MCRTLDLFENFLMFFCWQWLCFNFFGFASLVGIPIGIASSAVELKICALTAGIEKYESFIKEKRKNHDEIVLLAKNKLNILKVFDF